MNKQSRREPRTNIKLTGRNITRILGVTAIVVVSALVGLSPLPPEASEATLETTPVPCADSRTHSNFATVTSPCQPLVEPDSGGGGIPHGIAAETNSPEVETRLARARYTRPYRSAPGVAPAERPQSGFTLAEICAMDAGEMRCRTGVYGEISTYNAAAGNASVTPNGAISGRVMTAAGDGVPGMTLVASPGRLSGRGAKARETLRFWTVTDRFGAYSFQDLPEGEYTLRSNATDEHQSARTSARTGVDYADIVVPGTVSVTAAGRIVTPIGEPLEGVIVLPMLPGQPSVRSNDRGSFHLPLVLRERARAFALRFQRPGFNDAVVKINYDDDPDGWSRMEVVMEPVEAWTSVSGVLRGDDGAALAERTVILRPVEGRQSYTAKSDRDGVFAFPGVESPADYRLIVEGDSQHKDFQQQVHVHPRLDRLNVNVESWEFGKLTGQLRNATGVPLPNFELVLRNEASQKPVALLVTDHSGNFRVPAAPAGELVISSRSTPHLLVQGLQLEPGGSQHLDLTLDWGSHQIRGIVTDSRGMPVPASQVILKWLETSDDGITSSATRRTAADLEGRFAFNSLGPGPHSLRITAPGFRPVDVVYDLSREGYDMNIRLDEKPGDRSALAPIPGATAYAQSNPITSL